MKINGSYIFPDPVLANGNFKLKLDCTREPVFVRVKVYTSSFRLIRDLTWQPADMSGTYEVSAPAGCLDKCGSGTYIYSVSAMDADGKEAKGNLKPFVVLH
jgi:hypothetical protein